MRTAFGSTAEAELKKPFKSDEWAKVRAGAEETGDFGTVTTELVDEFDLVSVNHFFNIFEKHWEVLTPVGLSGPSAASVKRGFLGFLREIKSVRDPISHPPEADLSREDAFRVIDSARRVVLTLDLPESQELQKHLSEIWSDASEPTPSLAAQLPPNDVIVQRFIGRDSELLDLWSWLTDPNSRRWLLVGDGGKGKSALAYEFASQVRDRSPEPLVGVVWLSAKRRRFVEGSVLSDITPDFSTLDEALRRLLTFYDKEPEADAQSKELLHQCLGLLDSLPLLVVVDDIDSIESEEDDATEFFDSRVPNTKSKVLFTSRRTFQGFGKTTTPVPGFSLKDGTDFIKSRIEMFDLDRQAFGQDAMKRLVKATDGSPLYLEDLLRLTAVSGSLAQAITAWSERGGAEARRYALGRECDLLGPTAKKVLFAAAAAGSAVSHEELRAISGVRDESLFSALQELQSLFLIPKPTAAHEAGDDWRFELNVNTRRLVQEVYGDSQQFRLAVQAQRSISQGLPRDNRGYAASAMRQASFLIRAGQLNEAEDIMLRAKEGEPANPDVFGYLGYLYKQWNPRRATDARDAFRRAAELRTRKRDPYFHWIRLEIDAGDSAVACEAAEAGLKNLPGNRSLLYWAGRANDLAARELQSGLHWERARQARNRAVRYLTRALTASDVEGTSPNAGMIYKALALTAEAASDFASVARYAAEWMKAAPTYASSDRDWQRLSGLSSSAPLSTPQRH